MEHVDADDAVADHEEQRPGEHHPVPGNPGPPHLQQSGGHLVQRMIVYVLSYRGGQQHDVDGDPRGQDGVGEARADEGEVDGRGGPVHGHGQRRAGGGARPEQLTPGPRAADVEVVAHSEARHAQQEALGPHQGRVPQCWKKKLDK